MSMSETTRVGALPEYVDLDGWFVIVLTAHKFNQGQDSDCKIDIELCEDEMQVDGETRRLVKYGGAIIEAGRISEFWAALDEYQASRISRMDTL